MAKDPAFLFYSSDFMTGVSLMSMEQRGKYITLLCLQHQSGHLTEQDMLLICGTHDKRIFSKFNIDEHGLYFNARLNDEFLKRKAYSESRAKNRKGATVKTLKEKNISKSYVPHMENENEDISIGNNLIIIQEQFKVFWDKYGKKTEREKCFDKFSKLKEVDRQKILDVIDLYISVTPDVQYRKNPSTWLNNKCWNDEIVKPNKPNGGMVW